MKESPPIWFSLNNDQKRIEIRRCRIDGDSFATIAVKLLGNNKKKSTIWSWAQRNMDEIDIYPDRDYLSRKTVISTDFKQWEMFDILSYLYPRLDAMTEHLLTEVRKIHSDQHEKFTTTAGFLDNLEGRIIEAIRRNIASLSTNVSRAASSVVPRSSPQLIQKVRGEIPPPPPPPGAILPQQSVIGTGKISELRTDFEEMSLKDIIELPPDFLEALTPSDRNRLQERVKELKKLEKMTPDERQAYLKKKIKEKEIAQAAESLDTSLSSMLDDSTSLFARMRRAADESQVSGSGTFGKFTTEFNYYYCIACSKMNRTEAEILSSCEYCGANEELLVLDDERSNYTYWECLSKKNQELVEFDYTRGKQIVIKSRWKNLKDEPLKHKECEPEYIREITSSVLVKEDPDKQFSHFLALFRMYMQFKLDNELKNSLRVLMDEIQALPDLISKETAVFHVITVINKVKFILEWLEEKGYMTSVEGANQIEIQQYNLIQDIEILQNPESPQELSKASELGQVVGKADQILNRFSTILNQLEPFLFVSSKWKCSECKNIFEVKDRYKFPEKCVSCGKIITKLELLE